MTTATLAPTNPSSLPSFFEGSGVPTVWVTEDGRSWKHATAQEWDGAHEKNREILINPLRGAGLCFVVRF